MDIIYKIHITHYRKEQVQSKARCLQVFFAATGVSDGDLLKGVRYFSGGASTNSIVMRSSSGTVRYIETHHRWRAPNSSISRLGFRGLLEPRCTEMHHRSRPPLLALWHSCTATDMPC